MGPLFGICYQSTTLSTHRHPPSEFYRLYSTLIIIDCGCLAIWCMVKIYVYIYISRWNWFCDRFASYFENKKPLQTGILLESTHLMRLTFAYLPITLQVCAKTYRERQGFYHYLLGHFLARSNELHTAIFIKFD